MIQNANININVAYVNMHDSEINDVQRIVAKL